MFYIAISFSSCFYSLAFKLKKKKIKFKGGRGLHVHLLLRCADVYVMHVTSVTILAVLNIYRFNGINIAMYNV